jgi:trk system potassium uptake protein TrkA
MFAGNRIELAEVELPTDSAVLGIPMSRLKLPAHTRVGAVIRGDRVFVPEGKDALAAGDRVYLFARAGEMHLLEDHFCHGAVAGRVVVYGGNVLGEHLCRQLGAVGVDVTLLVEDRDNAERLALCLPRVTVIHGDGTDSAKLDEVGIGGADLYFAVTHDDENNLMSGLLAKRLGCPRASCVVHRHAYIEIYRQLGIDMAISPRQVAADHILRYARPAQVESVIHLGDGGAEVLEVVAAMESPITGKPLSKLTIPAGISIGGIVGIDGPRIPGGDDQIEPGDTVVVMALTDKRKDVEKLFRRSLF